MNKVENEKPVWVMEEPHGISLVEKYGTCCGFSKKDITVVYI